MKLASSVKPTPIGIETLKTPTANTNVARINLVFRPNDMAKYIGRRAPLQGEKRDNTPPRKAIR